MKSYLNAHRLVVSINCFWLVINSLLSTLTTVILTQSTNAIFDRNIHMFAFWISVNFGLWCLNLLSEYFQTVNQEKIVQTLLVEVRDGISKKIAADSYSQFHRKNVGQYLSMYIKDTEMVERDGFNGFFSLISQIAAISFDAIALATYHWSLLLLGIILAMATLIGPRRLRKPMRATTSSFSKSSERIADVISNLLGGFDVFFNANKRRVLINRLHQTAKEYGEANVSYTKVSARIGELINLLSIICQIAIDILTSVLAILGKVTLGAISSTGLLAGNLFNSLSRTSNLMVKMNATETIFAKLSGSGPMPELVTNPLKFNNEITLRDVGYEVEGRKILQHINLTIKRGEKGAIVGRSGVGKTTLLKLLNGQIRDYTGAIQIDGKDYRDLTTAQIVSYSQYIDQNVYLFNDTVANNVTFWQASDISSVNDALEKAHVDFIAANDLIMENGQNLSGGQKQRLAIARYFFDPKPVVFFDEGTSALDVETAREIEQEFTNQENLTFIEVSHHLDRGAENYNWVLDLSETETTDEASTKRNN